ncbi:hypothetical protein FB451DRAFT_1454023 [Mycena latifolia]|nr:hypothetical protein FB451DRAFT_1454023 [Mycena latifolia]
MTTALTFTDKDLLGSPLACADGVVRYTTSTTRGFTTVWEALSEALFQAECRAASLSSASATKNIAIRGDERLKERVCSGARSLLRSAAPRESEPSPTSRKPATQPKLRRPPWRIERLFEADWRQSRRRLQPAHSAKTTVALSLSLGEDRRTATSASLPGAQ